MRKLPDLTINYNFKKPTNDEAADIQVINENMDVLDAKLKEIDTKATNISVPVTSVNNKTGDVNLTAADVGAETPVGAQAKISAHEGRIDPHPQYATDSDLNALSQSVNSELADIVKIKSNITIIAAAWTQNTTSQLWEYKITDTDINSTTMVDINIQLPYLKKAEDLLSVSQSFNGYALLYASDKPAENIIADMKLIRQVI